jgi:CrcB protein
MMKLALIALGGGGGAAARWLLAGAVQRWSDSTFPLGTLAVNLLGCLLIGILGAIFAGPHLVREEYRLALLVGLLGGFTTFSTFGWETFELINDGSWLRAAMNILLSNALGLAAVGLGYRLTTGWLGV